MNNENLSALVNLPDISNETKSLETQFLTFLIQGEYFALNIKTIKEILNYKIITKMPFMPNFVHGVLNLRGVVIPVIDLSARLHNKESVIGGRSSILIIDVITNSGNQPLGILVDGVSEVLNLNSSNIDAPPKFGAHLRPDFIVGVTRIKNNFIIILNQDSVFSIEEMAIQIEKISVPANMKMARSEDLASG